MVYLNANGIYEMLIYYFDEECYWAHMKVRKQIEELALSFTMWALGKDGRVTCKYLYPLSHHIW